MPQPSDQEKFSIDEIIDRLKNPPDEQPLSEGELVTRADGTQAIRVRKRKRRSQQPQMTEVKRARRARMVQVAAVLALVVMVLFAAGSAVIYANSAPFREKVVRMIATSSGAEVKLEQFRVNPTRAVAGRLILSWPQGNALRELDVRGASADISPASFLGKSLIGDEVNSDQGILTLGSPQAGEPLRATAAGSGPRQVRFRRHAIPRLQVRLGDPAQPLVSLRDSEGSFQPDNANGRPQLLLNRGFITARGWPAARLDRSHIEFRGTEIDIVGMRLLDESDNRGTLELDGTVLPYASDRASSLAVRLDSFLLSGITGPELGRLISGRISSVPTPQSNFLTFTPGPESAAALEISFRNATSWPVEIHGFPFLSTLARVLEDNWFERPVFEVDAIGTLRRTVDGVTLDGLNFQNKGRLAIRGSLTMEANRRLSGNLEVGIAQAMVETSSNRRLDAITGPPKDGFRWLTVKIGGNANTPSDDFLLQLDAAKLPETKRPAAAGDGAPSFEELTAPE